MSLTLLVYTHKITPRLTYVFKHICMRMLGVPVKFTIKVEDFVAHEGPKLSYTTKQLGEEFFIKSDRLLFEQGIQDIEIKTGEWNDIPCFFKTSDSATIPYDFFAASFYLMSRYEEYLPHVKDEEGRYPANESFAHKHQCLEIPLIDIWVQGFKEVLHEHFPNLTFDENTFSITVLIDVEQAFAFKKVGFLRTIGGLSRDVLKFRLRSVISRIQVLTGFRKDPYDTFNWLVNIQKQASSKLNFFFELGDYSEESKNIKYSKTTFQSLIKMVNDYSKVGLLVSKAATKDVVQLRTEKRRLENITHKGMSHSKVTGHLLTLPETYRQLVEQEIFTDFSLAYPETPGFRAGTCRSFLFYDLDYEIQTPLVIHPLSFYATSFMDMKSGTIDRFHINRIRTQVSEVHGELIVGFSNTLFTNTVAREFFKEVVLHGD